MSSSSAELGPPTEATGALEPQARRPRLRFLVLGMAIAAVLAAVLFGLHGNGGATRYPRAGDAMPSLSLPLLEGDGQLELPYEASDQLRGTVVSFFASWCGPCRTELPMVVATAKDYADGPKGRVRFVGIDGLDPPGKAKAFLAEVGWSFPTGRDASYGVTNGTFGFQGLPETVVVNGDGVITFIKTGAITRAELVSAIEALPAR